MPGRAHDAERAHTGGIAVLACALLGLSVACYPNPDDLRANRSGSGSGGAPSGLGGGSPGAGGHTGTGGVVGAGGGVGAGGAGTTQCGGPPCGGNLLGTWSYLNSCAGTTVSTDCAGEMLDASGIHRAGTLTFNGNGTYSTTETDTGTFVFDVTSSCISGATCASLQMVYQGPGFVAPPNPTFSSASCITTATGCRCYLGALGTPGTFTGTYVVSGTSVALTSSTGDVNANTFCVTGTIMHMIYADNTPAVPDELVLTKQ
jgi:hypothetical protein